MRDELHRLHGDTAQVELLDLFTAVDLWPFDRLPTWWPAMVRLRGLPWALLYRLTNGMGRVRAFSRLAWPYVASACRRVLRQHPADVVVSFHGVPNDTLQRIYGREPGRIALATVVLDLVSVHATWFAPGYDLYVVPTAEAADRARQWEVPPERLQVVGMPTRRSFVEQMDLPREVARAHLGLDREEALVLFVGGGEGMGPLEEVVEAIAAARPPAQLAVITGHNEGLRRRLARLDLPLRVEGFVTEMEVWLRAADLLVTKAGPNTLAEAFIAGRPVILYHAIPGQETGSIDYVVSHGAGIWAPRPEEAADATLRLLNAPAGLRTMAARSRALARPEAAATIAKKLAELARRRPRNLDPDPGSR